MNEKDLDLLKRNAFQIDCSSIILRRQPQEDSDGGLEFKGPGIVYQDSDGQLRFKCFLISENQLDRFRVIFPGPASKPGKILDDKFYYEIEIKDVYDQIWVAERIYPVDFSGYEPSGNLIAEARIPAILKRTPLSIVLKEPINCATIIFIGDITVPCSLGSMTTRSVDGYQEYISAERNVEKLSISELAFEFVKEVDSLKVFITSRTAQITDFTISNTIQALEFILSRSLFWDIITKSQNNEEITKIHSRRVFSTRSKVLPPITIDACDLDRRPWLLFIKYFTYISKDPTELYSNVPRQVSSIIRSGLGELDDLALTLSVAIESVIKSEFNLPVPPNADMDKQILLAKKIIQEEPNLVEGFKRRVLGFLETIKRPRPQDFFYKGNELVEQKLIGAWEATRHPSVHAFKASKADAQKQLDSCFSLLVLFYQLIFLLIGYTGPYNDYSTHGFPERDFNKRLDLLR